MIKFHPNCEFTLRDRTLVIKQLRQDINRVVNEENEDARLGIFSCAAEQYDDTGLTGIDFKPPRKKFRI